MTKDKDFQERLKAMRDEEIINYIRVDVIPHLVNLADKLERYIEGEESGDTPNE